MEQLYELNSGKCGKVLIFFFLAVPAVLKLVLACCLLQAITLRNLTGVRPEAEAPFSS